MRQKNVPVDIIEIKEPIHSFAWEPVGSKFAVIHGESSNVKVAFYDVKSAQKENLMSTLNFCLFTSMRIGARLLIFSDVFQNFLKRRSAPIFSGRLWDSTSCWRNVARQEYWSSSIRMIFR